MLKCSVGKEVPIMCLSTVYALGEGEKTQIAKNVTEVRARGGKLYITDIMGSTVEEDAEIEVVDLTESFIYIRRRAGA